ncbi:MAG TPA: serine/threonine-protein kinase, partial [Thermoanaerobaculia bacterium]|nr:serine/threonine-protein kinase [Thermoanaerobaculia bacterium]
MGLSAGTRLGPYEILAPIGAGGMGEVYRARDTRLDRTVALKVLPEAFFEDEERKSRFEREAKLLAALNHPSIAAVYAFEEFPGSPDSPRRHLLAMELLEGETLRSALGRGLLPRRRVLDIATQVADALAAAHEKRIVHRDVKPENVFLTKDGRAKLLDFGIARQRPQAAAADTVSPTVTALSEPGIVVGTVAYMSPEQARGEAVDFRSDQFSLGSLLYEMFAGRRPFGGGSPTETLAAILRDEPEALAKVAPALPAPVRWIVERCLEKDP